jgi:hypothetical protein
MSKEALVQCNKALKEANRLTFLTEAHGVQMGDAERVSWVIDRRVAVSAVSMSGKAVGAGAGTSGAAAESVTMFGKMAKAEKLHNSAAHMKAVSVVAAVLKKVGVTQEDVVDAVFRQGIPSLNQFILGKKELEGLQFYEDCEPYRCVWHGDSDVDEVVGRVIGRAVFRLDDGTVPDKREGFTLAVGDGADKKKYDVVQAFLRGATHKLNMENAILSEVTKEIANEPDKVVPDAERFTDYMKVDRMIAEVSPIYELFALGKIEDDDSFGAVLGEVKTTLMSINGLAPVHKQDLLTGDK